jgi:hypothetical protein
MYSSSRRTYLRGRCYGTTSAFNYPNMTAEGLVDNTMTTFGSICVLRSKDVTSCEIICGLRMIYWTGDVKPLGTWLRGTCAWSCDGLKKLVFQLRCSLLISLVNPMCASIPVMVYVDACDVMVGLITFSAAEEYVRSLQMLVLSSCDVLRRMRHGKSSL